MDYFPFFSIYNTYNKPDPQHFILLIQILHYVMKEKRLFLYILKEPPFFNLLLYEHLFLCDISLCF